MDKLWFYVPLNRKIYYENGMEERTAFPKGEQKVLPLKVGEGNLLKVNVIEGREIFECCK